MDHKASAVHQDHQNGRSQPKKEAKTIIFKQSSLKNEKSMRKQEQNQINKTKGDKTSTQKMSTEKKAREYSYVIFETKIDRTK